MRVAIIFHNLAICNDKQRWGREHKARGQGHKKIQGQEQPLRGQILLRPRTGILEAKAKDQGHKRKCSPKKKKRSSKTFFSNPSKKGLQKIFSVVLHTVKKIRKFYQKNYVYIFTNLCKQFLSVIT